MLKHASQMEFEKAAELRDKIKELEELIQEPEKLAPYLFIQL